MLLVCCVKRVPHSECLRRECNLVHMHALGDMEGVCVLLATHASEEDEAML